MSDDEVDVEETIEICKVTCVRSAKLSAWFPNVKLVDGIEYLKLSPWDKDLCRFTTGSCMQMKKKRQQPKHNIHVRFFPDMKARRKEACDEALKDFLCRAAEDAGAARPEKIRYAREEDEWIVQRSIVVNMPFVEGHGPAAIRFLWGVKSPLYMELSVPNLKYIKAAIRQSPTVVRAKAKATALRRPVGRPRKSRQEPRAPSSDGEPPVEADGADLHSEHQEHGFMPACFQSMPYKPYISPITTCAAAEVCCFLCLFVFCMRSLRVRGLAAWPVVDTPDAQCDGVLWV